MWYIIFVVWLIGALVAYFVFIRKWDSQSQAAKIYFSIIWPLVLPLYLVHLLYHKG